MGRSRMLFEDGLRGGVTLAPKNRAMPGVFESLLDSADSREQSCDPQRSSAQCHRCSLDDAWHVAIAPRCLPHESRTKDQICRATMRLFWCAGCRGSSQLNGLLKVLFDYLCAEAVSNDMSDSLA